MAAAIKLLDAVTSTGLGVAHSVNVHNASFQASIVGTGTVTATVAVEASNDGVYWANLGTFSLSGTTSATDIFAIIAPYAFVRGNLSTISGTGAKVTLTVVAA